MDDQPPLATETNEEEFVPQPPSSSVAGSLAAGLLVRKLREGNEIKIPSLRLVITRDNLLDSEQ